MKLTPKTPINKLNMIGPTYAKRLNKLEIFNIEDLLYHFPHRYIDARQLSRIASLSPSSTTSVIASPIEVKNIFTRRGKNLQQATIADESGQIEATWFNQPYLVKSMKVNQKYVFYGKVGYFGSKLTMVSPEYELLKTNHDKSQYSLNNIHTLRLVPVYPETFALSSKWLRSRIAPLLLMLESLISEWLPENILKEEKFVSLIQALRSIHFPVSNKDLENSKNRLAFDELFLLQLASQKRKLIWQTKKTSHPLTIDSAKLDAFYKSLPFTLTNAQQRAIREITKDQKRKRPMNRLLQGDVGAGKTVVAATAMYASYLNGYKSVLLAPTEILAFQHAKTIKELLEPLGIKISLQTGSFKEKLKNPDIFIGTHALLYKEIPEDLSLLVVDEQHRFGVEQRAKLLKIKKTPHLLSMTATPIPRTVALTIYGELDISVIDEMPLGRKKVKTWLVSTKKRAKAYDWIKAQISKKNAQVFVVCPFIEESSTERFAQVKAVETEFEHLKKNIFKKHKLGLLHGRLKSKEKRVVLEDFQSKRVDVLVSTPVIEVGIDIPQATIMLIEGAERFGLAQLHQLRGRVGRRLEQSYCLLFITDSLSKNNKRLKALETLHSGLKLAEVDLKLRGPGQLYGTKQHGFEKLKVAKFSDSQLVAKTNSYASSIIKSDPKLEKYPRIKSILESTLIIDVEPN